LRRWFMRGRGKMSRGHSRKNFRRTSYAHPLNRVYRHGRGGIRL